MQNSAINLAISSAEEDVGHETANKQHLDELNKKCDVPIGDYTEPATGITSNDSESEQIRVEGATTGDLSIADHQRRPLVIPSEPLKTLFALGGLLIAMLLTAISLSIAHDRLPDSPPLPDLSLQFVPNLVGTLTACEVLLIFNIAIALTVSLLHKYRCVVLRRVFFITGIVYIYRAVCIVVTSMPDSNWRNKCEPKNNGSLTFAVLTWRVMRIAVGGGFSITKSHSLCGDSIFSGHTASLTVSYLVINRYAPPGATPLRWISLLVCLSSMVFLLLSHGHYTVDLVVAYWLATRLWWIFHTMADNPIQKRPGGHLTHVWWFPIFQYLEANVTDRLPCEMQLPWPHGFLHRAYQRLRMRRRIDTVWTRVRGLIN